MQPIIGKFTKTLFRKKIIFKQKLKLTQLKVLIQLSGTIWRGLEENQNAIPSQLKWLIIP